MVQKYFITLSDQSNKALRIILIYICLSFLWIYLSDQIVYNINLSNSTRTTISMLKGWAFIIVSAMILFQLIRRALKDQELMQVRLKESEEKHRLLFQKSKDGILYTDPDGKIFSANEAACKMLIMTELEIKKKAMQGIVDKYDPLYSVAIKVRDGNGFFWGEVIFVKKNGTKFPVELTSTVIVDKKGNKHSIVMFRDITERKRIETEKRRWTDAFENCAHGIAIGDPNNNTIVVCNSAFAEITGRNINEISGISIFSLYAESEEDHLKRFINQSDQFGKVTFESIMIKKDGTRFPVQMDVVSVQNERGEITYRVATLQDITERKNAEEEYRKSELRFQHLVEEAPDAIFVQMDGKFFYVNEKAKNIFGFKAKEEMIGKNIIDQFHPELRNGIQNRIAQLNEKLKSVPLMEEIILKSDGTPVSVEVSAIPYVVGNNNGALVFLRDITERKKAEAEIQISRGLVKLAGEMAKIGGWEFDVATGEGSWTEQIAIIHDMDPADATSKQIGLSVYENEHRMIIESAIKNAIENGIPYDLELEMVTKKGNRKWVRTKGNPFYVGGKVVKLHGSLQDITDIKRNAIELEKHKDHFEELVKERTKELDELNKKLIVEIEKEIQIETLLRSTLLKEQQLSEMKGRFISTVSHEFRTPLTSVLTSIELMERYGEKWDREKTGVHIDRIKNSVASLSKLLDDVILINRSDAGKLEYNPRMIDLDLLNEKLVAVIKTDLQEGQKLEYKYAGTKKNFMLDEKLISSIINNILNNSIKYSPEGGAIKMDVTADEGKIRFRFSDEGIGIPKEDFSHMFETFYRSQNVKDIKGTGLGLSIVKRAVDLHNGRITFDSELGKGTKFTIVIPVAHAE